MDRLTNNKGELRKCSDCIEESNCYSDISCNHIFDALKKLAEYENLEERCLKETTWSLRILLKKWNEFFEDIQELYEYRKLEEQGLRPKLPCSIGSDVYFIPSKVNFDLNKLNGHEESNRVYHQRVAKIIFTEHGWYLECDKDLEYETDHILVDKLYQKTWFLSQAEAEEALRSYHIGLCL